MLEEISYWERSSWKRFVEEKIVPLNRLAEYISENLAIDPLGEEARAIKDLTGEIINISSSVFGEPINTEYEVSSDIIEAVREFLERGANLTAGHSPYTFFIWSTRRISRNYMEAHYSKLFDDVDKFREIAGILGWEPYWSVPALKSKLAEDYIIYTYPDYLPAFEITQNLSSRFSFKLVESMDKKTIGGRICQLNRKLWNIVSNKPGIVKMYEVPDVWSSYGDMCREMLRRVSWKDEAFFIDAVPLSENRPRVLYVFEGLFVKKVRGVNLDQVEKQMVVFEFWDLIMPPLFLGKYEIVLDQSRSRGVILERWQK